MVSVTPEELYRYCRIEDDEELQKLAVELAEAAESYLTRQAIRLDGDAKPRAGLCVKAMTLFELDHPGEEYPGGIRSKINDLKFCH